MAGFCDASVEPMVCKAAENFLRSWMGSSGWRKNVWRGFIYHFSAPSINSCIKISRHFPAGKGRFSVRHRVQTGSVSHLAYYPIGTGGGSPEVSDRGVKLAAHFQPSPRLKMRGAILPLPNTSSRFGARLSTGTALPFTFYFIETCFASVFFWIWKCNMWLIMEHINSWRSFQCSHFLLMSEWVLENFSHAFYVLRS
jgi:hypothetical protein